MAPDEVAMIGLEKVLSDFKRGGSISKWRMEMPKKQREAIARKAAEARWKKRKE